MRHPIISSLWLLASSVPWFLLFQTAAEGSNKYGKENSNYPVLDMYAEGAVIEMKVVVSTYHWVS